LDVVIFPKFKREMKRNYQASKHFTDRSKRILKILRCFESCVGPLVNNTAFESTGFLYDPSNTKKMEFDLSRITKNDLAPNEDVVASDLSKVMAKPMRIKVTKKKIKR